jgi:hypothetical protein
MSKVLILESDWRPAPNSEPTEQRSSAKLYRSVVAEARCAPLRAATWRTEIDTFLAQKNTQRGVNLIILSSHGNNLAHKPVLATDDGVIGDFSAFGKQLKRSILVFDACYLGAQIEALQQCSGALGAIGFAAKVNWTASSVFVLALLRFYLRHGVFDLQRCSTARPRKALAYLMQDYAVLAQQLGAASNFR